MEGGAVVEEENGQELPAVKQNNTLPIWGSKETMNINQLILKNIRSSPYFKQDLYRLKTYHEVVDEIYYKVTHLEPWEKNSRKLASQIGHAGEVRCGRLAGTMGGGATASHSPGDGKVRGVSAGGIVSSPFCLLYKLFTLKLTRKQLQGLLDHTDSPYIRGLGFMYIRYCQPPSDFLTWFEPYFDDDEMIDLKAGSGFQTTIGEMCKMMLLKLDWFGTLFPRIPVNMETQLRSLVQPAAATKETTRSFGEAERRIKEEREQEGEHSPRPGSSRDGVEDGRQSGPNAQSHSRERRRRYSRSPDRQKSPSPQRQDRHRRRSRSPQRKERSPERRRSLERWDRSSERRHRRSWSRDRGKRDRSRSREREDRKRGRSRSREREDRKRDRSRSREREDRKRDRSRSREREARKRYRSCSREREDRKRDRSRSREREARKRDRSRSREREDRKRDRSRSREREDRKRDRSRSREREDRKKGRSRSREREDRRRDRSRSREREDRKRDRSRSREREDKSSRDQEDRREKSRSKEHSRRRARSP